MYSKVISKVVSKDKAEYRCLVCSELYKEPPAEDWIKCDDCEMWAHEACTSYSGRGITGTVYCVGYAPGEINLHLEQQLAEFETEEQLQDGVARHMFMLMAEGDTTGLDDALQTAGSWTAKIDACERTLLGRVSHSVQYARALLDTALKSVQRARAHVPTPHALRSQLVVLRAAPLHPAPAPLALQRYSQRPVIVHQLRAPLVHAPTDLQCAAIVNAYLDPSILESFDKKNICNTYLLNANSFMVFNTESM